MNGFVHIEAGEVQFSITSLKHETMRILPQLFQDRVSLPLYEEDVETPTSVLNDLKIMLVRFLSIAKDYGVHSGNGQIAICSSIPEPLVSKLHDLIKETMQWPVRILSEKDEFEAFIYGLGGAFHPVNGLFLKVTARSAYLSWIHYNDSKELLFGKPHKLPYGGVSLGRRLRKESLEVVRDEVAARSSELFSTLSLPPDLIQMAKDEGGYRLYIHSRGFPFVMRFIHSSSVSPVLLSSLNSTGFSCVPSDFKGISQERVDAYAAAIEEKNKPKAAFFLASLALFRGVCAGIPQVRKLLYDRSTIREGIMFQQMPKECFCQDPLIVATNPYALPGANKLAEVLASTLPAGVPIVIRDRIVQALANSAYIQSSYPRTNQPILGLTIGLGGVLTGVPGITHEARILLGIALFKRWGGDPSEASNMILSAFKSIFADWHRFWWAFYIGCIMHVLGGIFPGAHVRDNVISFRVEGDINNFCLHVRMNQKSVFANNPVVLERIRKLPSNLKDVQNRLNINVLAVLVKVEWYSD